MDNLARQEAVKPVIGIKSLLRSTEQKETSPSKSKTPVLKVEESVQELAIKVKEAKEKMDTAKNEFSRLSAELIGIIAPQRTALCQREYQSSVKVPAGNFLVGVTWSSSYTKIAHTQEPELIKILGDEKYKAYFQSKFTITLKNDDESELYKLLNWLSPNNGETEEDIAIGQSRFQSFFAVEEILKPTENFIREHIFMSPETRNALELCGVSQYTPSIKIR